jgi:hypothetical protein
MLESGLEAIGETSRTYSKGVVIWSLKMKVLVTPREVELVSECERGEVKREVRTVGTAKANVED